ncbi:CD209 antigen-like protein E [Sorex araneus]|uniref:CD209 antigen-like protein E n=1 Tax=Sorex araneus TaxID=42254 RepID=UPI002433381B|nr:CD209 antigen-like protein E [Sorex araneus]
MAKEETGIFQTMRRWSGRLPRISLSLLQLLISLIFFLVLIVILVREETYGNLNFAENEVPQAQSARRCSGRLPRVSIELLQLLTSLGLLVLFVIILVQPTQKQIQEELGMISHRLARMNVTLERLCRQCPWDWELFQGSCYWFSRSQSDWMSTDSACQRMNARLVVVNSVSEEKFLQSWMIRHEKRTWIGLSDHHDEASWRWVDGTPFQLSFWKPGEPNNDGDEDCVELYNGGWNDDQCYIEKAWICEKPMVSCTIV